MSNRYQGAPVIRWLSSGQVAERLGKPRQHVIELIRKERLSATWTGTRWRVREDHLRAYQKRESGS